MDDVLKLPATLDVARARAVFEDLAGRRGSPLTIDASEVEKASALAVEILIAARRQWQADGLPFALGNLSAAARDTWAGLGLSPDGSRPAEEGGAP